ncbi:MAG: hypothetical protein Q8S18_05625 [Bacteroidales bacterium]|nr:hypothetical protein [Bacteroidales bacterium]
MKAILTLFGFFRKKTTDLSPLFIIKKNTDDGLVKEYRSIEEAIAELENDPNISVEKIEKLRVSVKNLKDKRIIKIKNGEIV